MSEPTEYHHLEWSCVGGVRCFMAWPKDISREDAEMFFEAVEIQKKSILRMADRLPATLATCGCRDRIDIPHAINCPESLRELAAALAKAEGQ